MAKQITKELREFIEKYSSLFFRALVYADFDKEAAWECCIEEVRTEYELFKKCFDSNDLDDDPSFGTEEANVVFDFQKNYFKGKILWK